LARRPSKHLGERRRPARPGRLLEVGSPGRVRHRNPAAPRTFVSLWWPSGRASQRDHGARNRLLRRSSRSVGVPRFELGTSCPPDKRANQAAPHPEAPSLAPDGLLHLPARMQQKGPVKGPFRIGAGLRGPGPGSRELPQFVSEACRSHPSSFLCRRLYAGCLIGAAPARSHPRSSEGAQARRVGRRPRERSSKAAASAKRKTSVIAIFSMLARRAGGPVSSLRFLHRLWAPVNTVELRGAIRANSGMRPLTERDPMY
jgi:hypothetical protein